MKKIFTATDAEKLIGKSVTVPHGYTSIGKSAFNYSDITSVALPDSITCIGESAFFTCLELMDVSIPNSVTVIGDCAFMFCEKLASITIPDSITSIGHDALKNLTVRCSQNSYAYKYCQKNDIRVEVI